MYSVLLVLGFVAFSYARDAETLCSARGEDWKHYDLSKVVPDFLVPRCQTFCITRKHVIPYYAVSYNGEKTACQTDFTNEPGVCRIGICMTEGMSGAVDKVIADEKDMYEKIKEQLKKASEKSTVDAIDLLENLTGEGKEMIQNLYEKATKIVEEAKNGAQS